MYVTENETSGAVLSNGGKFESLVPLRAHNEVEIVLLIMEDREVEAGGEYKEH